MKSFGDKIKYIRDTNNITQKELADILYVSEKTVSSWENNRTIPDLNMIYKISDYFKKSFYYLISENELDNTKELEIRFKVSQKEYERVFNLINKDKNKIKTLKQIDTYYKTKHNNDWLRIRVENGKSILNYKKKIAASTFEKYDVMIDNYENLNTIFKSLDIKKIGKITKDRIKYKYLNKYYFSFDNVQNIGMFIEVKIYCDNKKSESEFNDLLEILKKLNMDLNQIDTKKYIDYL